MPAVEIVLARSKDDYALAKDLFLEYAGDIGLDLSFQNFDEELAGLTVQYGPSEGGILLLSIEGRPAGQGKPEIRSSVPQVPPKLKEIRKAAVSEAEQQYLKDLVSFVGGDNNKACRISGLSRSRFYTLLKKYRKRGLTCLKRSWLF